MLNKCVLIFSVSIFLAANCRADDLQIFNKSIGMSDIQAMSRK